jgi:Protein of unknown function (DUF1173)
MTASFEDPARMASIPIEFPGIGTYDRDWLETHPEQAQNLLRQAKGQYPVCRCRMPGSPLYIAQRQRSRFYLARLPNTGPQHAPSCPSYEPEPSLCGWGIYSARALEDRGDGRLQLKLSTPLSIRGTGGTARDTPAGHPAEERLQRDSIGLRGLLHLIWERGELNRWRKTADKPRYAQVYHTILDTAESLSVRHETLTRYLFVPEPFERSTSLEIEARRQRALKERSESPAGAPMRVLVIGQLRSIVQLEDEVCGIGLAHLPREFLVRVPVPLLTKLYHETEFAWVDWPTLSYEFKLIVFFAMQRSRHGHWRSEDLIGMVTTQEYLPVLSIEEALLIQRLIGQGRGFYKPLPYDGAAPRLPNLLLTDCGDAPVPLEIIANNESDAAARQARIAQYRETHRPFWVWDCAEHALPPDFVAIAT